MLLPNVVQTGGQVIGAQDRNKSLHVRGVGRKIGFGDGQCELRRLTQIQTERNVLRQSASGFGLLVVAVESTKAGLCGTCVARISGGFRESCADLLAYGLR